ncbi:HAD domain-containing protein [Rhodoferax saidenbachensis]|uniref:HAD domain-containing protein n=1 Tax=Rhodoferax saidenbachensis TaxID=1484693 RepID=UPI00286B870D|nr:HAD domain-containing protein [Rhodoferax saidenbachensis]
MLYLDFDGVMHHENVLWHPKKGAYLHVPPGYELFQHASLLAELLEPFPEVQIVLSTSWALQYGVTGAAKRLPEALQRRVIGGTFHSRHMSRSEFQYDKPRGLQVYEDVLRRRPRAWLALDDTNEGWPPEAAGRFIQTDENEGISDPEVLFEIKEKLLEMAGEQH